MGSQHLDHSFAKPRPELAINRDTAAVIQAGRATHHSKH